MSILVTILAVLANWYSGTYFAYVILSVVKRMITVGILVFSSLLGWLGAEVDKGNWFGGWSIFLGIIGCFIGVWAGYKVYKLYF